MIQNLVFDIGNVLVSFDPASYFRNFMEDESRIPLLNQRIFQSEAWHGGDAGRFSRQDTRDILCRRYPEDAQLICRILENCETRLIEIQENTAFLHRLKNAGFSLYYLSNTNPGDFAFMSESYGFLGCMDGGVASFRVKQVKPNRDIYETLLKTYGLTAAECLFVDDLPANVETAGSLGMQTLCLKAPQLLADELLAFPEIRQRLEGL